MKIRTFLIGLLLCTACSTAIAETGVDIQDVKPGGLLNEKPAPIEAFNNALVLAKRTRQLGSEILTTIKKRYKVAS